MQAPSSKKPGENDFSSGELDTLRNPESHNGSDCEWRSAKKEEAQVYVRDLDLFVTVQILEDTPAVLS